ncbi:MAG: hypothetical protein Q9186_003718 [Xanthomendoza sp. 1 TL-2023]
MPDADNATYQNSFNKLQQYLAEIEHEGKTIFFKEHGFMMLDPGVFTTEFPPSDSRPQRPCPKVVDQTAHDSGKDGDSISGSDIVQKTNPSVLPDTFIRTLCPIIQIRHPAISIPSYYRTKALSDMFSLDYLAGTSYAWSRITFDWFCEHVYTHRKDTPRGNISWPLVVDGDDLVNDNERVISAICSLAELDMNGIIKAWDPTSEEIKKKQPEMLQRFMSTLQASTGIIKSGRKVEDISVDKEAEKWIEEFGSEVANRLKETVEATMDHYLYLAQFRI